MTSTLHDAIAAVRAGDTARAQLLAADIVRNNPNDPNAWYLLSQLVDSDARRAAYLSKTLALDPTHPRAMAEFSTLPPGVAGDLTAPVVEYSASPEVVTLTPEMIEATAEEMVVDEAMIQAAAARVEAAAREAEAAEAVAEAVPATGAPDWLKSLDPQPVPQPAPQPVTATTTTAAVAPAAPRPRQTAPARPARKDSGNQALTLMLGILAFLTVLVLAFLIYLLFF